MIFKFAQIVIAYTVLSALCTAYPPTSHADKTEASKLQPITMQLRWLDPIKGSEHLKKTISTAYTVQLKRLVLRLSAYGYRHAPV